MKAPSYRHGLRETAQIPSSRPTRSRRDWAARFGAAGILSDQTRKNARSRNPSAADLDRSPAERAKVVRDLIENVMVEQQTPVRPSGSCRKWTRRWSEVDSNHRSPSRDCRRSERFAQRSQGEVRMSFSDSESSMSLPSREDSAPPPKVSVRPPRV